MQFAEVKINSLSMHYFGEYIYQSNEVKNIFLAIDSDVDTTAILRFIELLCEHLDIRFPEEESVEWHTFDQTVIVKTTSVEQLVVKSSDLVLNYEENVATEIFEQFCDLKFVAAEKFNTGFISFSDFVNCALNDGHIQEISVLLDIYGTFEASSAELN
jgi:hypothetical protein